MSGIVTSISVSGNNKRLISGICSYQENESVKFSEHQIIEKPKYHLYVISIQEELENVSQKIISLYADCRENKSKLTVVLVFNNEILKDKVFYFQKLLNDLGKQEPIHRLVVTKDIYSISHREYITELDQEIEKVFSSSSINISSKGNNYLYPLELNDFCKAIIKIFFLNSTTGKTIYLLGEPIKDLEFAYILKNIVVDENPNFEINTTNKNIPLDTESQNLGNVSQLDINWRPSTDLENSLRKIYLGNNNKVDDEDFATPPSVHEKTKNKIFDVLRLIKAFNNQKYRQKKNNSPVKTKSTLIIISIFILSSLILLGTIIGSTYLGLQSLASSLDSLRQGDISQSVKNVNKTNFYNEVSINTYWTVRPLVKLVSKNLDEEIHNLFTFSQYLESSLTNLQQSYVLSEKIYKSFNDKSININVEDQVLALKTSLGQVYENLTQIDLMINSNRLPKSLENIIKSDSSFKQLPIIEEQLSQSIKLIDIIPSIASNNQTKTLAVIIQDQDELRSLGGVVKYLITVTITDAKIIDIKIYNQQDISNLSDGTVKAPEMITRFTGMEAWKFRDMTYIGDFSQTSQYLVWYLEKVGNIKPDTIVSINKSFFRQLMLENKLNEKSEINISEEKLTQKIGEEDNGVLRIVIDNYINLYRKNELSLAQLGRVVTNEISSGNIYLWTNNQVLEQGISMLPFSGVVNPYRCHSSLANYSTCISQTTFLTESNFTMSPVNQHVKREVLHKVDLQQNESVHTYQLNYHYLSDLSILNRDYRLVYQLYAPSESTLTSVNIDGQDLQTDSFLKQKYGQFEYFQIPIALSINNDHQVNIKFSTPIHLSSNLDQTAYSLTEIRQSGITDQGYGLVINLPENTHAKLVTSPVDTKPLQINYRFPLKTATFGLGLGINR